jgi:hypothetical protein
MIDLRDERVFTPRISARSHDRLEMKLSDTDWSKVRGRGQWKAEVTDLNTGKRYKVRGADCGGDCYCDAVVVKEVA